MIAGLVAILTALAYLCGLFAVAHFGGTKGRRYVGGRLRPLVYALTLCVYCTSWTFFGSVGLASTHGPDFLPVYLGPLLVIGAGYPFVLRILRLAKAQNITSIADFVAARYGKSQPVAALVATIAVVGAILYVALQLKAISNSLATVLGYAEPGHIVLICTGVGDMSLLLALLLAGFAMAFGTRRIDATEHQDGLLLAIATESVVKLAAFLAVGIFVTWSMFGGSADLARRAGANVDLRTMLGQMPDLSGWTVTTLLSASAILLLPRQFHVTIVENRDESDVKTAAWLVPAYLVAINIFVVPLAIAGRLVFADGAIDRDMTVLALPLEAHSGLVALFAMIGGLSAATAIVVVESVAHAVRTERAECDKPVVRGYCETRHKAKSWNHERRAIARIEATRLGLDIRFVVTNLDHGTAKWIYDSLYCARGQAENLIKLHKSQLASDRTSCRSAIANQVRLVLHTAAYWLMLTVRDAIPKMCNLANAEFATLRLRLIKIAARVIETASRVRVAFAACCPEADLFHGLSGALVPLGP